MRHSDDRVTVGTFASVDRPAPLVKNERSFYDSGMPRVTDAHRQARRSQILAAARRCFERDGFHATSMQDIVVEAKLSAGAIYLYFKSKDEIVAAVAAETLAYFPPAFAELLSGDLLPLDALLGRIVSLILELDRRQPTLRLAVQVWGEAVRAPQLAAIFAAVTQSLRELFTQVAVRYQAAGRLAPDRQPEHAAQVLQGMVIGFIVQFVLIGDPDIGVYQSGLRTILDGARAGN